MVFVRGEVVPWRKALRVLSHLLVVVSVSARYSGDCPAALADLEVDSLVKTARAQYVVSNTACFDGVVPGANNTCVQCAYQYQQACLNSTSRAFFRIDLSSADIAVSIYHCAPSAAACELTDPASQNYAAFMSEIRSEFSSAISVPESDVGVAIVRLETSELLPERPEDASCPSVGISSACAASIQQRRNTDNRYELDERLYNVELSKDDTCFFTREGVIACQKRAMKYQDRCEPFEGTQFCALSSRHVDLDENVDFGFESYYCLSHECTPEDRWFLTLNVTTGFSLRSHFPEDRLTGFLSLAPHTTPNCQLLYDSFVSDGCLLDEYAIPSKYEDELIASQNAYRENVHGCIVDGLRQLDSQSNEALDFSCSSVDGTDSLRDACLQADAIFCEVSMDFEEGGVAITSTAYECIPSLCENDRDKEIFSRRNEQALDELLGAENNSVDATIGECFDYSGAQSSQTPASGGISAGAAVAVALVVLAVVFVACYLGMRKYKEQRGRGEIVPPNDIAAEEAEEQEQEEAMAPSHGTEMSSMHGIMF